jgi:S-methylmethionine-dependent homocysteine/selenocysteine methylase
MENLLENNSMILMEGAILERLRRSADVELHDMLLNAPLIYNKDAGDVMGKIYQGYIDVAMNAGLPIILTTPTWRTNRERVRSADVPGSINIDAVRYMQKIRDAEKNKVVKIKIGGVIGCKNDCYLPEEALSAEDAQEFHSWQINELVKGGVDFLIAETLPSIHEALGIARAMQSTGIPYIISFVISRDGFVLDGTSLDEAINFIDSNVDVRPIGFTINCAYPSFLCLDKQSSKVFDRLIGYVANASSLDHCDLDKADQVEVDSVSEWGDLLLDLNKTYGVQILGGCCGTNDEHLQYLVDNNSSS